MSGTPRKRQEAQHKRQTQKRRDDARKSTGKKARTRAGARTPHRHAHTHMPPRAVNVSAGPCPEVTWRRSARALESGSEG